MAEESTPSILGHVEMNTELYLSLTRDERHHAWCSMIEQLGVTGAYIPIPYTDHSRDVTGMNLIGL